MPPDNCLLCREIWKKPGTRISTWFCIESDICMREVHSGDKAPERIEPGPLCVERKEANGG